MFKYNNLKKIHTNNQIGANKLRSVLKSDASDKTRLWLYGEMRRQKDQFVLKSSSVHCSLIPENDSFPFTVIFSHTIKSDKLPLSLLSFAKDIPWKLSIEISRKWNIVCYLPTILYANFCLLSEDRRACSYHRDCCVIAMIFHCIKSLSPLGMLIARISLSKIEFSRCTFFQTFSKHSEP